MIVKERLIMMENSEIAPLLGHNGEFTSSSELTTKMVQSGLLCFWPRWTEEVGGDSS